MMELVIATTNQGKLKEMRHALASLPNPPRTGKAGCFVSNSGENPDSPPNPHRGNISAECRDVTDQESIVLRSLSDFRNVPIIDEDQSTFEGNALKKARVISQWSGLPTLADDSGLVVEALNGNPGIHSARYAGAKATDAQNVEKLLKELKNVPMSLRHASFVCLMAYVAPEEPEELFEGRCHGMISFKPQGDSGFGYDPVFFLTDFQKTMAEISLDLKNQISHRGKALDQVRGFLLEKKKS